MLGVGLYCYGDGEQGGSDDAVGGVSVVTQGVVAEGGGCVLSETNCEDDGGSEEEEGEQEDCSDFEGGG